MTRAALAKTLIASNALDAEAFQRAETLSRQSGQSLRVVLDRLGLIAEDIWAEAAATACDLKRVSLTDYPDAPLWHPALTRAFQTENSVVALTTETPALFALADPTDEYAVKALRLAAGADSRLVVATQNEIADAFSKEKEVDGEIPSGDTAIETLKGLANEAPTVKYVADLLRRAAQARASDIHIEPLKAALRVRLRIDGVLREVDRAPKASAAAIVSRIKILAGLDIAERRLPQDGRLRQRLEGRDYDVRVATGPSLHGESAVLRLLEQTGAAPSLAALGLPTREEDRLLTALETRHGMVIVTGPTGSGKTTTLHALLSQLNKDDAKIITIEDPVEYELDGAVQIEAKADIGRSFAQSLRAVLRQDPDILMIGEMRDSETAAVAAQSALTGHTVLTTLHTNDAPGAIARLIDMGVEPFLVSAVVRAVVAQRLLRKLCPECKTPVAVTPEMRSLFTETFGPDADVQLHHAKGCEACGGTGYAGRIGVYEVMTVDDAVRAAISPLFDEPTLRRAAGAAGLTPLDDNVMRLVADGVTSLEEALRVAGKGGAA